MRVDEVEDVQGPVRRRAGELLKRSIPRMEADQAAELTRARRGLPQAPLGRRRPVVRAPTRACVTANEADARPGLS